MHHSGRTHAWRSYQQIFWLESCPPLWCYSLVTWSSPAGLFLHRRWITSQLCVTNCIPGRFWGCEDVGDPWIGPLCARHWQFNVRSLATPQECWSRSYTGKPSQLPWSYSWPWDNCRTPWSSRAPTDPTWTAPWGKGTATSRPLPVHSSPARHDELVPVMLPHMLTYWTWRIYPWVAGGDPTRWLLLSTRRGLRAQNLGAPSAPKCTTRAWPGPGCPGTGPVWDICPY